MADLFRKSSLEKHGEHGWNIVKVNGKPYHIDFTWDVANLKNGIINYDYYNLPEEAILLDHSGFTGVPKCTSFALPHHKRPISKKYLQCYLEYLCRHKKNDAA